METNVQKAQLIFSTILSYVMPFLGVVLGFLLGFVGEFWRQRIYQHRVNAELMRALLQEIGSNRMKCQAISANRDITTYLESGCWDRIRFSDTLYHCITSRDNDIYQRIIALYMRIARINILMGAHLSAVDSLVRVGGQTAIGMVETTFNVLREAITLFLPQLTTLETDFRDFLIREGFFRQPQRRRNS